MKKLLSLLTLILIICTQISDAQTRWDEIEYPEINNFDMPEVEIFELDNGITFYLVEDEELPLIDLRIIVRTGSVLDSDDIAGRASMVGTVMRSGGSASYPDDELNELLENRAARIESGIGFSSGSVNMNVLKEDFEELLPVLVDVIQNPVFPDDKIELAKTQAKTAISRRNDEQGPIASREFRKLIYGEDSKYARHTEYETIDNITRDHLIEFHENSFVGNNYMIGITGDFDADEIKGTLRNAFSSIPAGTELELNFPEVDYEFKQTINFVDKPDVNQSYVLLGHIGGLRSNPDYAKLQVMNQVVSGGFSSRLFQVVRTDLGLAYAVFGNYGSNNYYPGIFTAGVMTQSETTAEAIDAIIEQLERLQNELVSQEELQQTKDQFLNSLVFRYDSRSKILNERLSNDYAGLDPDTFDKLVEEVRAVTPEDIMDVAKQYLRPTAVQILVVGNAAEIGDQLEKYGDVNHIDITIPTPGDDEEEVAGDAAGGAEWINRMAEAVLPGGIIDGNFVFEAENKVNSPQGEITLKIKQTANFDTEYLLSEVQTPMANVVMRIEDGQGTMEMGGNEMPMPPAQRDQALAEFYRSHLYLAANKDQLDVEFMGMQEMEGEEYALVRVVDEITLNLYLNPDTYLPEITTYRQFDPQSGGNVTIKLISDDWRVSDGVMVPYETTVYNGENVAAVTTISTHYVE